MNQKTFREYLNACSFEDVWMQIAENFNEPEAIKPVYADYYERLKKLPAYISKEIIEMRNCSATQPKGMNAAPDFLIDWKVKTVKNTRVYDASYISAVLLYWASLHTFHTSAEHDDDLRKYLQILHADDPRVLGKYLSDSLKPNLYESIISESIERKEQLFWENVLDTSSPGDWRGILYVLKRKLEYNMGFMRGFADHAGREHDADRMQQCCNLIDGATANIYPDERRRRMLKLLFKVLEQNITNWSD